ncbi:MAG: prolyl-tRNA synthetase [Candidatus Nealsonbacteria bacterium]|nr:prolyl-tRNA synthetase [Candidatus Nealsonbacteria bacterium]
MKQSQLLFKAQREAPKDEKSVNAKLLVRAAFVDKLMAGVYSYLPLGFLVLKKIENIIREEMVKVGGQELLLPALHPKENWAKTGRWQTEEMFKLKSRGGKDYGLGWTHEEIITPLVKKFVSSHKDLPLFVFQIQNKFRDELRAKSGILRGIEFIMKDLYSFHKDEKDLSDYYEKVKSAYFKIFARCGLKKETFLTLAGGGTFSKYSHEFQAVTPYGEDLIYLCRNCSLAINKEIIEGEGNACFKCKSKNLEQKKAIELGNIFKLNDRFSKAFDFYFKDVKGQKKIVFMGCYGIGLGRLMGAIAEINNDKNGIIWPKEVAPFLVHLIPIEASKKVIKAADNLYDDLQNQGIEVLYDDRYGKGAGEKLVEADLLGIPYRMVVSEKTLKQNSIEFKERGTEKMRLIKISNVKVQMSKL